MEFLEFIDELDYGISIKYPSDWEKKVGEMGTLVVFLSPIEDDTDRFRENLSILTKNIILGKLDLNNVIDFEIEQLSNTLLDFKLLEKKKIKISKKSTFKLIYTGKHKGIEVKITQFFTIRDNKIYLITFTAELSQFDIYYKIIKKMIKSFKFI